MSDELKNKEGEVENTTEGTSKESYFDNEDVRSLLEKVRKEEKNKTYSKLTALKTERKELREQIEKLQKQQEEKELSKQDKIDSMITQIETLKEMLEVSAKKQAQLEKDAEDERERFKIDKYRDEVIKKAEGKIISDLVIGDTESEIDATAIYAQKRYMEIANAIKSTKSKTPTPKPKPPTDTNPASENALSEDVTVREIRNSSDEEYSKIREKILKKISPNAV